jgi:methyltransferase (TIGR00027 family)
MAAARLRAAHQVIDAPPPILDDPVAVGLVADSGAEALLRDRARLDQPFFRTLRASFVARSALAEAALERAVAQGTTQLVLLGAGLDTFAWRQPPWAQRLRIFELDHPESQADKRERMQAHPKPPNLRFVAIDFEHDALAATLAQAGANPNEPAFVSWLGVVPYLTRPAIEASLGDLVSSFDRGQLVLSSVVPDSWLRGVDAEVVELSSAAAAARGEPWKSRFTPDEIARLLHEQGFRAIESVSLETLEARYFTGRRDELRPASFERVMEAHFGTP